MAEGGTIKVVDRPSIEVVDVNNDGFISEGETVTVTPEGGQTLSFQAHASSLPDVATQNALEDIGLDPKYLVGSSIPGVKRFAASVTDYLEHAGDLNRLFFQASITPGTSPERLAELVLSPIMERINGDLSSSNNEALYGDLNQLHWEIEKYPPAPRLQTRLERVVAEATAKLETELGQMETTAPLTPEQIKTGSLAIAYLDYLTTITTHAGIRAPKIIARLEPLYTRIATVLCTKAGDILAYIDAQSKQATDGWGLQNLIGRYDETLSFFMEREIGPADGLTALRQQFDEKHYGYLDHYLVNILRAEGPSDTDAERIKRLQEAIDLRSPFEPHAELSRALALDIIAVLRAKRVSQTKTRVKVAVEAKLNLTAEQRQALAQVLNEQMAAATQKTSQALAAYTHQTADSAVKNPTALATMYTVLHTSDPLATLEEIAKGLIPADDPAVATLPDIKPVYDSIYTLFTRDDFLMEIIKGQVSVLDVDFAYSRNALASATNTARDDLKALKKTYLLLFKRAQARGGVHGDQSAAKQKITDKFTQALAHCDALSAASAAFDASGATIESRTDATTKVGDTAKALGLDLTFLEPVRRELRQDSH